MAVNKISFIFNILCVICAVPLINCSDDYATPAVTHITTTIRPPSPSTNSHNSSSDWRDQLEISHKPIGSMEYGNLRIKIYSHLANKKYHGKKNTNQYYYSPVALLDHESARSYNIEKTHESEMQFRVQLWNDDIQKNVTKWIRTAYDSTVNDKLIQVIPFENVILSTMSHPFQRHYKLPKKWTTYEGQKHLIFTIQCPQFDDCNQLAEIMRDSPNQLKFEMLFSMTSSVPHSRKALIKTESLLNEEFVTKLNQQMPDEAEFALLIIEDKKRLLDELTRRVITDTFDDSVNVVLSPTSHDQIYNAFKMHLFTHSTTVVKEESDEMWQSVFWNEEISRPDKTLKVLNELFTNLSKEEQTKLVQEFKQGIAINSDQEQLNKVLKDAKNYVIWDGYKFTIKHLVFSKVSLKKLRDVHAIKSLHSVILRYSRADLVIDIKTAEEDTENTAKNHCNIEFEKRLESRLESSLANLEKQQLQIDEQLTRKMDLVQSQLTSEYTNKLFQLEQRIKEFKNESSDQQNVTYKHILEDLELKQLQINELTNQWKWKAVSEFIALNDKLFKFENRFEEFINASALHKEAEEQKQEGKWKQNQLKTNLLAKKMNLIKSHIVEQPVYFNVHRTSSYDKTGTVIPYEGVRLNVGGGMNPSSGVFTAPRSGAYLFMFTARSYGTSYTHVDLRLNGGQVLARSFHDIGAGKNGGSLAIQSAVYLKEGDTIDIFLETGSVYDQKQNPYTQFTGVLLQQDLTSSQTSKTTTYAHLKNRHGMCLSSLDKYNAKYNGKAMRQYSCENTPSMRWAYNNPQLGNSGNLHICNSVNACAATPGDDKRNTVLVLYLKTNETGQQFTFVPAPLSKEYYFIKNGHGKCISTGNGQDGAEMLIEDCIMSPPKSLKDGQLWKWQEATAKGTDSLQLEEDDGSGLGGDFFSWIVDFDGSGDNELLRTPRDAIGSYQEVEEGNDLGQDSDYLFSADDFSLQQ